MSSRIPKRTRFFVCVEGRSEASLIAWWKKLSEQEKLHIHLDVYVSGGGDSRSIVDDAVNQLNRQSNSRVTPEAALVLLDFDRVPEDRKYGRDPEMAKGREKLQLIYLRPNLEGLLLRLCNGCETQYVSSDRALPNLRRHWEEYTKPMSAAAFEKRVNLDDLRRTANHDGDLQRALTTIGLIKMT